MKTLKDIKAEAVNEFTEKCSLLDMQYASEFLQAEEFVKSIIERTAKEAIDAVRVKKNEEILGHIGNDHDKIYKAGVKNGRGYAIDEAAEREREFLQNKI